MHALANLSSTYQLPLPTFAFSCWRRGTAERWMRSACPLTSTFRLRTFTQIPPPSRSGRRGADPYRRVRCSRRCEIDSLRPRRPATPSFRRPFVNTPAARSLCLLLPVAKRHEGTEFHSGGVKEPECARAAARQGDRGAVDEEQCVTLQQNLNRGIKRLIRQPSAATFSHRRRHTCTLSCSCLLPPEKA